jgi:hypothetical protein
MQPIEIEKPVEAQLLNDLYRNAFKRSLQLRSQERSQRRVESRSKNRLLLQKRIMENTEEL